MKQQLLHLVGWAFLWLLWVPLAAQDNHVRPYGLNEGLSSDEVVDVHKDRLGYLWVATSHGLNQFNGHEFRIFRYDPEDSFSIRANSLDQIFEDNDANIWAALSIGGVSKYDRYEDRFYHYTANRTDGADQNNFIKELRRDKRGRTWIGTSIHINLLNEAEGIYEPVPVVNYEEVYVSSLYEDNEGLIWLGTTSGLFRYNETSRQFEEVLDEDGLKITEVVHFVETESGQVWAASYHDVYQLSKAGARHVATPSKRFIVSMFVAADDQLFMAQFEDNLYYWTGESWQVPKGFEPPPEGLRFALAEVGMEVMLVADNVGGSFLFDLRSGKLSHLMTSEYRISSFWFGAGARALWLGTVGKGLFKVDLRPKSARHVVLNEEKSEKIYQNYVSGVLPVNDNESILVMGGGLYRFNSATATGQPIQSKSLLGNVTSEIVKAHPGAEDELMLLTRKGFAAFNVKTGNARKMPGLAREGIHDFLVSNDSLWSIGSYGLALTRLSTKETLFFSELDYMPDVLKGSDVRMLYQTKDGTLWVGTIREGLVEVKFDRDTGRFSSHSYRYGGVRKGPLKTHTVNDLLEDEQGRLWVGGFSSGLLELDRANKTLINHTPEGELPIPHINALTEAFDGSIWMSALDGVHRYDKVTQTFHQFGTEEGLSASPFLWSSGARLKDSLLAFGTASGLTLLDPSRFSRYIETPEVLLASLTVQNDGTVNRLPDINKKLTLKYDQNFLAFDFIAFDYLHPQKVAYQYRLKGLEKDWNTTRQRHVQYANLGPGTYTFEVRAGNEAGDWSETVTQLSFYIHKPFWWQPWFLILLALVVMVAVLVVNRIRLNMKLSKVRALEIIRQNAAADFHDEMGNKLTRISLFSEVLENKLNGTSPEISDYVKKIKDNSQILNNSMRDFLWALDPEKDTTFDLIVLLKDFGDELFDSSDIHFHVASINEGFREYPLDMDWKRHLVMIFKEAMHNALKYSEANKVTLKATLSKDVLNLSITDNGVGFSESQRNVGYGHANMRRRANELGASVTIETTEGTGTVVTFIGTLSKEFETYD